MAGVVSFSSSSASGANASLPSQLKDALQKAVTEHTLTQVIANANFQLATLHAAGSCGVRRDPVASLVHLQRAAEAGHATAEFHLGIRHLYGDGVWRDEGHAMELFKRASAHGHVGAANRLQALAPGTWRRLRLQPRLCE